MFTIIGAMAERESSLISERITAGMRAAEARGKHLGRSAIPRQVVNEIKALATSTQPQRPSDPGQDRGPDQPQHRRPDHQTCPRCPRSSPSV